ncbi:hypothetical protein KAT45_00665 [Candidatus Aerophobetes bacterium]|nr:hypothetical protein [Candidatus Aerophobetes bacterium]
MQTRRLIAAFLLGVGLCFVPVLGHGEVKQWEYDYKAKPSYMDFLLHMNFVLLEARVNYMMRNSPNFLYVSFYYDPDGSFGKDEGFPEKVDTEGKVFVAVIDNKGAFSDKSGVVLLKQFKMILEPIYSFIHVVATDMDNDVVAKFHSEDETPLGYFYQGEYHLWEK